jgi:DNA-directed RNA polymerase subunit RPC12/RpoP
MGKNTIECKVCGGSAEIKYENISLFDGKITLRDEPYYKCSKCKREFVTSEQMKESENRLNMFYVTRPVIATGRSLAISIPSDLAKFYSLKKGTEVKIIPENKQTIKIMIT